MMRPSRQAGIGGPWGILLLGVQAVAGLFGMAMLGLGLWLLWLGGTPYYAIAGALMIAGATLTWRGRSISGLMLLGAALLLSIVWALGEIGLKGWQPVWAIDLAARVGVIGGLFAAALLIRLLGGTGATWRRRRRVLAVTAVGLVAAAGGVALAWERPVSPAATPLAQPAFPADTDWAAFGGTNRGERYSPAAQVTPANVNALRPAWQFHTGDAAPNDRVSYAAQNTPLKVGDTLFLCSPGNMVFALDPGTGAERWRFDPKVPAPAMESMFSAACRAVGYHADPGRGDAVCATRVFVAAADGRLIALDARRGTSCPDFGQAGTVDLTAGMGLREPGHASSNSGPAVVGDLVLVGQQVSDNQRRDAPSGVVRAYDATSGALRWAGMPSGSTGHRRPSPPARCGRWARPMCGT